MLHISLDRTAKRTYTRQIYYGIRQKILSGQLASGDALPPYRELSQELGVSKNTVLSAYDMLVADGVLRSTAGSGFYVEEGMLRRPPFRPAIQQQSAALSDRIIPDGVINFDNGQPALELFPRAKWNKAVSAAMLDIPAAALGYDLPQGRPELRQALCAYLQKIQGVSCTPEQLLITSGAKQAITLAAECLLAGGKEVWIEDPDPTPLRQILACRTGRIVSFPVDEHGLDPAGFPADGRPALIITSPARQFPTGAIMPMKRRMALVAFAERAGAYLLEDNFESEFNYDAPPASSLYELAPERVLSAGTFSKVLYPSVRLGYLMAPPALMPLLCQQKRLSDHHTNPVYQLALTAFLEDGTLEKHVRRMKREYRGRRDHLIACLHREFGERVRISGTASGMNLVAAFRGVCFTDEAVQKLLRCGVYAVPVERQGQRTNELILRYAGMTRDALSLGAERLRAGIEGAPADTLELFSNFVAEKRDYAY